MTLFRGVILAAALAFVSLGSVAAACEDCREHEEVLVGVTNDGYLVTAANHSTGESDLDEDWELVMRNDVAPLCTLRMEVWRDHTEIEGTGAERCAELIGLGRPQPATKNGPRLYDKRLPLAKVVAKLGPTLGPAPTVVPLPAGFGMTRLKGADGYHEAEPIAQPLLVDGIEVARLHYGASNWAITGYAYPGFDGVVVRLTTLLRASGQRIGSMSYCTDYFDGYVMLPTRRIEAARLAALAARTTDAEAAKALLARATERDPALSSVKYEIRQLARRRPRQCK